MNSTSNKGMNGVLLAVTPSVMLRPNQAKLYEFILGKHKAGATINLPEVIKQYSQNGNRWAYKGQPYYYRYDWKEHRDYLEPLTGDLLRSYAIQWFIHNLGIFVAKGLLTAIPTLELSQLQIEAEL